MRKINRDCRTINNFIEDYEQREGRLAGIALEEPAHAAVRKLEHTKSQIGSYNEILSHWDRRCSEIEQGRVYVNSLEKKLESAVDSVSGRIAEEFEKADTVYKREKIAGAYANLVSRFENAKRIPAIERHIRVNENEDSPAKQGKKQKAKPVLWRAFKAAAGIALGFSLFTGYTIAASAYEPAAGSKSEAQKVIEEMEKTYATISEINYEMSMYLAEYYEIKGMPEKSREHYFKAQKIKAKEK